jgi:hypothetical protein
MRSQRLSPWQRGLAYVSAGAALVLLAVFYSVVSAAVDRAASRRAELNAGAGSHVAAAPASRSHEGARPAAKLLVARATR